MSHRSYHPVPTADEVFVRQKNVEVLKRVLKSEVDPDARRVIRRLLREQERAAAKVARSTRFESFCAAGPN
jgi:hypothetical protein